MEEKYFFNDDDDYYNNDSYYNTTGGIIIVDPFFVEILLGMCIVYSIYGMCRACYRNERRNTPVIRERLLQNRINKIKKKRINFTNDLQDKECSICLEEFKENELLIKLECNHYFHEKCIHDWFKSNMNCPLCRLNLVI